MAMLADALPTTEARSIEIGGGGNGKHGLCPSPNGTFEINQYQLYPENVDFDFDTCLLYLGSIYNASISVYNPSNQTTTIITVPGVTHNPEVEIGAVAKNPYNGLLTFIANAPAAFSTMGADLSGSNLYFTYNLSTQTFSTPLNLTALATNGTYGGFQDIEFDSQGHTYVVGSYPGSILRIEDNGTSVNQWYKSPLNSSVYAFGGLVTAGNWLITNDNNPPRLLRFDMRAPKGSPVEIPITSRRNISDALRGPDAILLPRKYHGTVMLVSLDIVDINGVTVLRSRNGKWNEAEDLGTILNTEVGRQGGFTPATVQIGERIFMVEEFFLDTPKNRSVFPFVDITEEVDRLVRGG
ncbi:TRI14-like protein [Clohesyomyces aquaticus]|uniref:TRI14-like protein n=1 Tax=Clohesyomyces aquaticus TaxID=1231657 RepID=A0A1Y1Y9W1_9PLEO|nr:TRI14-like protein [Clohesyomyces aquaticus]